MQALKSDNWDSALENFNFSSGLMGMLDGKGTVSVIHATFDDVGQCHQDRMTAVVGYVAYKEQWEKFNWAWMKALQDRQIESLHTTDYLRSIPIVGGGAPSDDDVYLWLEPFIKIINNHLTLPDNGRGYGVCVITDCDAYQQLTAEERQLIERPELHSFEMAAALAVNYVKDELHDNNSIAFQFDESNDAAKLYKCYKRLKAENDTFRKYLGAICFVDDRRHPPVQAADLLGNLTIKTWRNLKNGKPRPRAFTELITPNGAQRSNVAEIIYDLGALKRLVAHKRQQRGLKG